MEFNVKVRKLIENGKPLKATCSVTMDGQFAIHGVKVIKTEKGSFIAMPYESYKDADGNITDTNFFDAKNDRGYDWWLNEGKLVIEDPAYCASVSGAMSDWIDGIVSSK